VRKRLFYLGFTKIRASVEAVPNITHKLLLDTLNDGLPDPICNTTVRTLSYISVLDSLYYGHLVSILGTFCPCDSASIECEDNGALLAP
jgi:hypothetical protein